MSDKTEKSSADSKIIDVMSDEWESDKGIEIKPEKGGFQKIKEGDGALSDAANAASQSRFAKYLNDVKSEIKKTRWPNKSEVAKWSVVVAIVVVLFALFCFVVDSYVITPLLYAFGNLMQTTTLTWYGIIDIVVFFISGFALFAAIMVHQGGETSGISESALTNMGGAANGAGTINRNLDKITVILGVVFAISLLLMMILLPQGTIAS